MDKNIYNALKMGVVPAKLGILALLYPYVALTSCKTGKVYNRPRVVQFISAKSKKKLDKNDF